MVAALKPVSMAKGARKLASPNNRAPSPALSPSQAPDLLLNFSEGAGQWLRAAELLRLAVIGIICHGARQAGRQEEAESGASLLPQIKITQGSAKEAAGPVLCLWSKGILNAF
uniref:Uncharacterized protein n=1 Tax=Knipowitschia caucasica TaxID=637954 RepID=A0AAV2LYP4_KNICA